MAVNYNIEAEKGSTFVLHVQYLDDDNNVVDLSGMTASMQVRRYDSSDTKLVEWKSHNGGVSIFPLGVTSGKGNSGGSGGILLNATYTGGQLAGMSGSTGGIYVVADPTTMTNVPEGQHYYDIELIQGNTILRLVQGRFEVVGNVTR
jgi:hypothetical protein|tara:strand:- start:243 stop:683 length:441 start_codon:yes stop_codon:yes gene_type:complete